MNYHLLKSVQCSEAILVGTKYETVEGSTIEIGCDGDSLTVNGIKMVLKKDIVTTNGVIHLIDQVLIPDSGKAVNFHPISSSFAVFVNKVFLRSSTLLFHVIAFSQGCDGANGRLPKHVY